MTLRELCRKDVVQIESGAILGRIDDIEFDPVTSTVERFIMLGRPRLFGLLGREEGLLIDWNDIVRFGVDTVLVKTALPDNALPHKKKRFANW